MIQDRTHNRAELVDSPVTRKMIVIPQVEHYLKELANVADSCAKLVCAASNLQDKLKILHQHQIDKTWPHHYDKALKFSPEFVDKHAEAVNEMKGILLEEDMLKTTANMKEALDKAYTLATDTRTSILDKIEGGAHRNELTEAAIYILKEPALWSQSKFAHELDSLISQKVFKYRSIAQQKAVDKKIKQEKHQKHLAERRLNEEKTLTVRDLQKEIGKLRLSLKDKRSGNRPAQSKDKGKGPEEKEATKKKPAGTTGKRKVPPTTERNKSSGASKRKRSSTAAPKTKSVNSKRSKGKGKSLQKG